MKKPTTKLALQTETIRVMTSDHLAYAAGGSIQTPGTSVISMTPGTSVISMTPGTSVISRNPSGGRQNPSGG